jgi:hypothetical protein
MQQRLGPASQRMAMEWLQHATGGMQAWDQEDKRSGEHRDDVRLDVRLVL